MRAEIRYSRLEFLPSSISVSLPEACSPSPNFIFYDVDPLARAANLAESRSHNYAASSPVGCRELLSGAAESIPLGAPQSGPLQTRAVVPGLPVRSLRIF